MSLRRRSGEAPSRRAEDSAANVRFIAATPQGAPCSGGVVGGERGVQCQRPRSSRRARPAPAAARGHPGVVVEGGVARPEPQRATATAGLAGGRPGSAPSRKRRRNTRSVPREDAAAQTAARAGEPWSASKSASSTSARVPPRPAAAAARGRVEVAGPAASRPGPTRSRPATRGSPAAAALCDRAHPSRRRRPPAPPPPRKARLRGEVVGHARERLPVGVRRGAHAAAVQLEVAQQRLDVGHVLGGSAAGRDRQRHRLEGSARSPVSSRK